MTEPSLSQQAQILARYLGATASDAEREDLERRLLTDDDYFEAMLTAEVELLDQFNEGSLFASDRDNVSHLLELSDSLRSRAQLGAYFSQVARENPSRSARTEPVAKKYRFVVVAGLLGFLVLLSGWQYLNARLAAQHHADAQAQLQRTIDLQQAALSRREQEVLTLQQELARLQLLQGEQTQ